MYAEEISAFIELKPKEIGIEVVKQIPEHIARLYNMVVFKGDATTKKTGCHGRPR